MPAVLVLYSLIALRWVDTCNQKSKQWRLEIHSILMLALRYYSF
jgi:hypothetical protein